MNLMSPDHKRLGARIDARIADLWPDYNTAADAIGVSTETLSKARRGTKVSRKTLLRIESAIGWAEGSIDDVLAGGEPRIAPREITRLPRHPGPPPTETGRPRIHVHGVTPLREDEELSGWPASEGRMLYVYTVHSATPPLVYRIPMSSELSLEEAVRRARMTAELTQL